MIEEKEQLLEYKKRINSLTEEEQIKRDKEYIMPMAKGIIQGPQTEYAAVNKPWLSFYEASGFDELIPKKSIYQYLRDECDKYSDKIALECFDAVKVTYKELFDKIDLVASALVESGVKAGDIVSVCLPNIPEVGYVFYAINKIGAVANMLDPRTDEKTLGECVNDANSKLLITLDTVADKFLSVKDKTKLEKVVTVSAVESMPPLVQGIVKTLKPDLKAKIKDKSVIKWNKFIDVEKKQIESVYNENSPAVIAYTGGTTGVPKGVVMSNEALNAMIVENKSVDYNISEGDTCISMAPPWTYYGLSNNFNVYLHLGITIKLIPMFGPNDLGKIIAKNKPNHVMTVPSALEAVKVEPKLKNMDLSFLKTIIVGADRMDPTKEQEFNDFLAKHNCDCKVTKGYGMTEVTAAATFTKENTGNIPNSVGIPFIYENISVFDDNGYELPIGEKGNIGIKGPKNMMTYFGKNVDKNKEVIVEHPDGSKWIHSGDIGHMDKNGNLYIDGRIKRMFVKAGFKIFASEIEAKILEDKRVAQCGVIAVEDPYSGFKEKAYITLKEEYLDQADKILAELPIILKSKTYDYEIPDEFEVLDSMPLTGMNKIDFKKLEEMASSEMEKGKTR